MSIQKVLIVDDSKTETMFLTDILQRNGFAVRSAENADEALKPEPVPQLPAAPPTCVPSR